jgi:hypothetical protein
MQPEKGISIPFSGCNNFILNTISRDNFLMYYFIHASDTERILLFPFNHIYSLLLLLASQPCPWPTGSWAVVIYKGKVKKISK